MKIYIPVVILSLMTSLVSLAQLKQIEFENVVKDGKAIMATGALIDDNGTFATVVLHQANPEKAVVKDAEGNAVALKLIAHDAISRMTLFQLPEAHRAGVAKFTKLANTKKMNVGEELVADISNKMAISRVVSYVRRFNGRVLPVTFIQANVKDQVVQAGAPVINTAGELVGLTYQPTVDKQSFYILPAEVIPHLQAASKFGAAFKPCWVGVSMDHLSDAPRIIGVRPETPAKAGGLQKGDVIISIDNVAVSSYPEVVNAFYYLQRDKPTDFKILRGVEVLNLTVTPEVNPIYK